MIKQCLNNFSYLKCFVKNNRELKLLIAEKTLQTFIRFMILLEIYSFEKEFSIYKSFCHKAGGLF